MKKIVLFVAAAFSIAVVNAQQTTPSNPPVNKQAPDPKTRVTQQTDKMAKALNVNDDTKSKLYNINYETAQKMSALKAKYESDKKTMQRERLKLMADKACQMKSTLTPEQYDKWLDLKIEERQKHMHARRHHRMQQHDQEAPVAPQKQE